VRELGVMTNREFSLKTAVDFNAEMPSNAEKK
jgi:hypothetical protein